MVHSGKGTGKSQIVGTTVSLTGGMFALLDRINSKSDIECDVDIVRAARSFESVRRGRHRLAGLKMFLICSI